MKLAKTVIRRRSIQLFHITVVIAAATPLGSHAADQGLVLIGYNANYFGAGPAVSEGSLAGDVFCGKEGISAMLNANQAVLDRVSERIATSNMPSRGEIEREALAAQAQLCQGGTGFQLDPSAITYSACRLTMDQQAILMDMTVPSVESPGAMDVADFWKAEVMRIPLHKSGSVTAAANTSEWKASVNWTGPGDSRQLAGYSANRWDFQYTTNMNVGGGGGGMSINMSTDGHGYFSRAVPGFELLETFYKRISEGVSIEEGGGSFFGGMMNTWVEVLKRGVPLEMDQTVTSNMGGMNMGGSSRSVFKIFSVQLVDLPKDYCTAALTPDYFEVTDAGQGLSGMSMSPGGGPSGAGSPGAESGVSSMGSIMDMINSAGQQGTAVSGAQQAPPANAGGQPAARAQTGNARPSSADLTTNDLTQSVQKHLQALGYDTGNTDGELSTDTVIAISQFQAEKGMPVTGEVTPQLLGILGAEVDARR